MIVGNTRIRDHCKAINYALIIVILASLPFPCCTNGGNRTIRLTKKMSLKHISTDSGKPVKTINRNNLYSLLLQQERLKVGLPDLSFAGQHVSASREDTVKELGGESRVYLQRSKRSSSKRRKKIDNIRDRTGDRNGDLVDHKDRNSPYADILPTIVVPLSTKLMSSHICPVLQTDPRMIFNCSNGRRLRSRCSVKCLPGYRLKGEKKTRRCRLNRKHGRGKNAFWTGKKKDFRCISACEELPVSSRGTVQCSSSDNIGYDSATSRSCEVTCDPGYAPRRGGIRHCQPDGSWSGEDTTCEPIEKVRRHLFVRHQTLQCGHTQGLTTFILRGTLYLAAADKVNSLVRIYRWNDNQTPPAFSFTPWQIISSFRPIQVEAIHRRGGNLLLIIGNEKNTTVYRFDTARDTFEFLYRTRKVIFASGRKLSAIELRPLKGAIYRCKTQKRGKRSIIVVQKLIVKRGKRGVFKRVMRRRMKKGERIFQCSMFAEDDLFYTAVSLNGPGRKGKIVVGAPHNERMKIKDILLSRDLRHLSDLEGFRPVGGSQYIVVGQATDEGHCFVYRQIRPYNNAHRNTGASFPSYRYSVKSDRSKETLFPSSIAPLVHEEALVRVPFLP